MSLLVYRYFGWKLCPFEFELFYLFIKVNEPCFWMFMRMPIVIAIPLCTKSLKIDWFIRYSISHYRNLTFNIELLSSERHIVLTISNYKETSIFCRLFVRTVLQWMKIWMNRNTCPGAVWDTIKSSATAPCANLQKTFFWT